MKESKKWLEVMNLAEKHGFIVYSHGGVSLLAIKEEQEKIKNKEVNNG